MEFRQRASQEQFTIILDFMEIHGDLSRPLPGLQGRIRTEQLWLELTELLNSVGGSGIQKSVEKWKRVWSDYKTKTKKKVAEVNGGGPNRTKPLKPLEERVLRMIGTVPVRPVKGPAQIIFQQADVEADIDAQYFSEYIVTSPSPAAQSPPDALGTSVTSEAPPSPEPCSIEASDLAPAHYAVPVTSDTGHQEDTRSSSPAGPSPPRRRSNATQRRRRFLTPFEYAIKQFVRIEERRLRLEELRIKKQHQKDMQQLRVEAQRNEILQRIADTTNGIVELLSRPRNGNSVLP